MARISPVHDSACYLRSHAQGCILAHDSTLHVVLTDNYKHKWTAAEDKMLTHGSNVNMELLREKFDDDQINAHASMLAVRKLKTIANK